MKDFDVKRAARAAADRDFKIGGEVFTLRAGVRPEALSEYESMDASMPAGEALKIIDGLVTTFIETEGDAHGRYLALREREDDPVTLDDLQEIVKWMVETQSGRPTEQPSPSSDGPGRTGTTLTAVSSSPDIPAASTA